MSIRPILLSAFFLIFLTACSTGKKVDKADVPANQSSAEALYSRAAKALEDERYIEATKFFEEVERQHPYSQFSKRAQIMSAYSSYLDQRYTEAVISLDRYIELHPGAEDVDYAYYLKALSFYEQISDVRRDQDMTIKAVQSLNTLLRRFPNSEYARDATLKRDLTLDHLAGKEMEIGRYYLERGHVNAAINRFRSVIANFQTTSHAPEALHRLVESYLTLGVREEALQVAVVLGHNYPGNKWYERTYKLLDDSEREKLLDDKSFLNRTFDRFLKPANNN